MPTTTKTYRLAATFVEDHMARGLPEQGTLRVVRALKNVTVVELDLPAYLDLLSDADHYSNPMIAAEMREMGTDLAATAARVAAMLRRDPFPGSGVTASGTIAEQREQAIQAAVDLAHRMNEEARLAREEQEREAAADQARYGDAVRPMQTYGNGSAS